MSDRRNRRILLLFGLLLAAGGGLACCLGAGVFGRSRSDRQVFDPTLVRWWNEGGWMSFATVVAIGVVAALIGTALIVTELRRNDGRSRTGNFTYLPSPTQRGETTVRAAALSHTLESDLETIPVVQRALIGLFGAFPAVELRAVLDVVDETDLKELTAYVDSALDKFFDTTGIRVGPAQFTIRFRTGTPPRQVA